MTARDYAVAQPIQDVASEVEQLAAAVRALLETSPVWAEDSIAARQITEEAAFAGPTSRYPVKHALLTANSAIGMAADHLAASAATIRAERTIFATVSLIRPVLSASGTAFYLLDPTIDVTERLRRSWNHSLQAFGEQLAMSRRPGDEIATHAEKRRRDIADLATAAGFDVKHPPWKRIGSGSALRPPSWHILPKPPSEGSLAADPFGDDESREFGWLLFRLTSAFVHAQPTALHAVDIESTPTDNPGVVHADLGMNLGQMLTYLVGAAISLRATALRALHTFGRDANWWNNDLLTVLRRWLAIINLMPEQPDDWQLQVGDVARAAGFLVPQRTIWRPGSSSGI